MTQPSPSQTVEEIAEQLIAAVWGYVPSKDPSNGKVLMIVAAALRAAEGREICICAAIQLDDGRVIRGHRHDDCIQTAVKWKNAGQDIGSAPADQGFVTSRNRFVTRAEGAALMRAVGHVTPDGHRFISETLFSEDLY